MPFIKRYPDGSVFDYTHGHRTAEQVAKQQNDGSYDEPTAEETNKVWGTLGLLVGMVAVGSLLWGGTTNFIHDQQNKAVVLQELETVVRGSTVLDTKDKDVILLRMPESHPRSEGESAAEHSLHTVIVSCEAEEFVENEKPFAAVVCDGFEGSLVVELPHK